MKKISHILAIASLVLGLAASVGAYEISADALKAARQKAQVQDYIGAVKAADEAVALAGTNANAKIDALFFKGQIAEWSKDSAKAKEEYAKVAAEGQATVQQKVSACFRTAAVLINENKMDEARAEYEKIAGLAGVVPADVFNAKIATAKSYELQWKYEKAAGVYAGIYNDAASLKLQIAQAIRGNAAIFMATCKYDEARAEYAKILSLPDTGPTDKAGVGMDIAGTYESQKNFAKARKEYSKALAVEGLDAKGKANVLTAVARTFKSEVDLANMKKTMVAILELVPAPNYFLLRDYALLAAFIADAKEEEAAWAQIMAIPGIGNAQYAEAVFRKIGVLAADKQSDEAKKLATEAIADVRMSEEQKFLAALLTAGFNPPKDGVIDLKSLPVSALNAEKQAKLYTDAAKVFMRAKFYEAAKFFGNKAEAMFPPIPRYVYECKFMDKAPFGVSGWQNSDIVKDPSRRETRFEEYNKQAAALLIYDVNAVRDVGTGDAKKVNIGFYMAADARGLHIYVHCQDEQVEQVLAGLTGGGSLEMSLRPGKGECYYQWIMELPSGKTSFYPWTSPNRHYRKIDDYFKAEVAPVNDGFGVYMLLTWDLFYDKLPGDGDLWTFGLINWSRGGGFTWGSGQVHDLERFGKIKFTGIDQYLPMVKRAIVMKAFANYKNASASATTFWNDEVKGDRDFHDQVLLPRIEQFNELGKRVRPEMTPADVEMLFEQVVPDWMEFGYLVSELRTEHVQNMLFAQ